MPIYNSVHDVETAMSHEEKSYASYANGFLPTIRSSYKKDAAADTMAKQHDKTMKSLQRRLEELSLPQKQHSQRTRQPGPSLSTVQETNEPPAAVVSTFSTRGDVERARHHLAIERSTMTTAYWAEKKNLRDSGRSTDDLTEQMSKCRVRWNEKDGKLRGELKLFETPSERADEWLGMPTWPPKGSQRRRGKSG